MFQNTFQTFYMNFVVPIDVGFNSLYLCKPRKVLSKLYLNQIIKGRGADLPLFFIRNKNSFDLSYHSLTPF